MTRNSWMMLTAWALIAALTTLAQAADDPLKDGWTLSWEDNFDRPSLGTDWVVMRHGWHIENGKMKLTHYWTTESMIRSSRRFDQNIRLEAQVTALGEPGIRVAVHVGDQWWYGGERGTYTEADELPEIALSGKGEQVQGIPASLSDMARGKTYQVIVEFVDGKLRGWVDGKLVKDEPRKLPGRFSQSVGFYVMSDTQVDNVKVYTKPFGKEYQPWPMATPESNRQATADMKAFFNPSLPDLGIQKAIDSLPASGGTILLPEGTLTLRQSLILRSGVTLRGHRNKTVLALSMPLVTTNLTAAAEPGQTTLTVADIGKLRPGWQVAMGSGDNMGYLTDKPGYFVEKVRGNTITLNRPLTMKLAEKTAIGNWFPILYAANGAEIEIRDVEIAGRHDDPAKFSGGYMASAVTFMGVRDVRVHNVTVRGWKGDAISLQGGRDSFILGNKVYSAQGMGYHPGSCQQRVLMTRNFADSATADGFYFCRYNQQSVIGYSQFDNSKGAMIGGLASAGDAYNVINFNTGKNNVQAVPFGKGANNVFVGNQVFNSGTDSFVSFSGGKYTDKPNESFVWAGPARYHVIGSNSFKDTRVDADKRQAVVDEPGVAGVVVANNLISVGKGKMDSKVSITAPLSVVANNGGQVKAIELSKLPEIPELPIRTVNAAAMYDPDDPDAGFQKAIDQAAQNVPSTVQLPAGVYVLRQALTLKPGVTLAGEGIATKLVADSQANLPALIVGDQVQNSAVRRLSLWAGSADPKAVGIRLIEPDRILIDEVYCESFAGAGVDITGGQGVLISQSKTRWCGVGYQIQQTKDLDLVESFALESTLTGIRVRQPGERVRLEANIVWFSREAGIRLEDAGNAKVTLMSNLVSSSGRDGIILNHVQGAVVKGNVILNNSLNKIGEAAALLLSGSTKATMVTENRMVDDLFEPHQITAVREIDEADGNTIQYNALNPNNWPASGKLDQVVILKGKTSTAADNVTQPYTHVDALKTQAAP